MEHFGCRVHVFDPKLQELGHHKHSPNITFHLLSIGDQDLVTVVGDQLVQCRTLLSVYRMLSAEHGNAKVIDFLKIESHFDNDLAIMQNLLRSGILSKVRQMEIVVRFKGSVSAQQMRLKTKTIKHLDDAGFVRFSSVPRGNRIHFSEFEFFDFGEFQLSWFNGRLAT